MSALPANRRSVRWRSASTPGFIARWNVGNHFRELPPDLAFAWRNAAGDDGATSICNDWLLEHGFYPDKEPTHAREYAEHVRARAARYGPSPSYYGPVRVRLERLTRGDLVWIQVGDQMINAEVVRRLLMRPGGWPLLVAFCGELQVDVSMSANDIIEFRPTGSMDVSRTFERLNQQLFGADAITQAHRRRRGFTRGPR